MDREKLDNGAVSIMKSTEFYQFKNLDADHSMSFQANRLESFKKEQWPFMENCACTPEKMAQAGFFHCPTDQIPDAARCFCCLYELEGWDPDDDPMNEHRKHTIEKGRECEFARMGKPQSEQTVEEFLKCVQGRYQNLVKSYVKRNTELFEKVAGQAREQLEKIGKI